MAENYIPTRFTSTCLDLTISVPGLAPAPAPTNSSSPFSSSCEEGRKRNFDINEVPIREVEEEEEEEWRMATGGGSIEEEEQFDEEGEFPTTNGGPPRKKLRLTKEQSRLLEDSFRHNHTLNPKQKEGLAKQLNLKPRQVEVWFQNRRARSKLKQTEMECEYLRRWFGSLTEQNRRLLKEVEELRALKVGPPTIMTAHSSEPLPASTLTMCPRCERVTTTITTTTGHNKGPTRTAGINNNNSSKNVAVLSAKVPFVHSRHSPAAC